MSLLLANRSLIRKSSVIPTDVFAHYKFDGNFLDESPNGYNLSEITIGTGATPVSFDTDRKLQPGSAVKFLNTTAASDSAYLSVLTPTFDPSAGISVSYWMKVIGNAPNADTHIELGGVRFVNYNVFLSPTNTIRVGSISTNYIVNIDEWHYYSVMFTDSVFYLYVDGVLEYTETATITLGNGLAFGWGVGNYPFWGLLDDVRIFERILTINEISALYNE